MDDYCILLWIISFSASGLWNATDAPESLWDSGVGGATVPYGDDGDEEEDDDGSLFFAPCPLSGAQQL